MVLADSRVVARFCELQALPAVHTKQNRLCDCDLTRPFPGCNLRRQIVTSSEAQPQTIACKAARFSFNKEPAVFSASPWRPLRVRGNFRNGIIARSNILEWRWQRGSTVFTAESAHQRELIVGGRASVSAGRA